MRGVDVLCEVLETEGVRHVFGNPGTTELPLIDELAGRSSLQYVLGLQEAVVVGMADGYARVTRRPAFVNLHASAGLGNGIGNLTNAVAHHAPMVVTAGNADTRHAAADPVLAGDLVAIADGATKWRHEVRNPAELGTVMRRAFRLAAAPPKGPVFCAIPTDMLDSEVDVAPPPVSQVQVAGVASAIDDVANTLLADPDGIVIVVGDPVADATALDEICALAEQLGAPVYGAPFYGRRVFPTRHPLWRGMLPAGLASIRKVLEPYRTVLLVDDQAFLEYGYEPGPVVAEGTRLLHISPDVTQIGRTHAVSIGVAGDVRELLVRLGAAIADAAPVPGAADRVDDASRRQAAADARLEASITKRADARPMHPMVAAHALVGALPPESIVVDEAITTGAYVRGLHRTDGNDTYWFCRGGGLGWGMPAAVGVSLGTGGEPVLAVIGDGSAMYSPQALWTAARERLPVVFAVVDNGAYVILERGLQARGSASRVGLDLTDPAMDFVALATSMGVPATRAESPDDARAAVEAHWGTDGPFLVHVPIDAR